MAVQSQFNHLYVYQLLSIKLLIDLFDAGVVESAHYAAFREGGLGRSLYAPMFQLSEITPDLLRGYVNKTYTPERVSMSGVGISMEDLQAAAAKMKLSVSYRLQQYGYKNLS